MYALDHIRTADDLRHVADYAGSPFFSPATMRAFKSRLLSGIYAVDNYTAAPGNRFYFVTSDVWGGEPRHYTVRYMDLYTSESGKSRVDIGTADENRYANARAAHKAADALWRSSRGVA